jgi:signal transduction histidine kinase
LLDEALQGVLAVVQRDHRPWVGEVKALHGDGGTRDLRWNVVPLREADGRVTHLVAIVEDVSEHKRLDAELESYRRGLESAVVDRTRELRAAMGARENSDRFLRSIADSMPNIVS